MTKRETGVTAGRQRSIAQPDSWTGLRELTPARLALGRTGASLPTQEVLRFSWDHAQARDAVQLRLDVEELERALAALSLQTLHVTSQVSDRATYLMRPDLGRRLVDERAKELQLAAGGGCDLALVAADGLSSLAVQRHAAPVIEAIVREAPADWRISPVVIASGARVALGDEIGERLGARMVAILIGERPGLSSPDSLGIYLTWAPRVGRLDAERNCISNIRPEGLGYTQAARKLVWLCRQAQLMKLTGVALKDRSDLVDVAEGR
ncbi:MAG: ethanolamine ammonia-lyase subunit EutC [Burkholderiaceae bacterium]|nr:ethanolamine ammonia-lyase subunit EutC [Burkholderiaceae bacterium]